MGMPISVTANFANQKGQGDTAEPDSFTLWLNFKDGAIATAKAGVVSVESEQLRFWVRGSKASYKKYHLDCQEDQLIAGRRPSQKGFGVEDEGLAGTLTTLQDGKPVTQKLVNIEPATYMSLYDDFAQALLKNDPSLVPVKASEARDVLRLIEAAMESAKTKCTVNV